MGQKTSMAFLFLLITFTSSYPLTIIDRDIEVVTVDGAGFQAFTGADISPEANELFLYAYHATSGEWQQIPFQFDEKDSSDSYFGINGDDIAGLDANDELSFLNRDAADQNTISWIPDLDSQNYVRYEIKVLDPLTAASKFTYLYRSKTLELDPKLSDYVVHIPSKTANMGEDQVQSMYYDIKHTANGLPVDLSIPTSAGGNNADLLDRLKVRANVSVNAFISGNITENSIQLNAGDTLKVKDGLVRVIRQLDVTLVVDLGLLGSVEVNLIIPPSFYFPFASTVDIEVPSLSVTVNSGRLSVDLNAGAMGMKFVSANNPEPGFTVDGKADAHNNSLDNLLPDNNWAFLTGEQGTLVYLFPLESTLGGARSLYYKDDAVDNDGDTGDKKSYADVGPDLVDGITPPFTLSYKGYYLEKNQSSSTGSQIAENERNPLQATAQSQDFGSVPVELVAFSSQAEPDGVLLTWQTATETNNFGFDIERRLTGISFWARLGFIAGHGTISEPKAYEFFDNDVAPGTYEYRLKQIDFDGAYSYSQVLLVTVGVPETFSLNQNYPNPFNPTTSISYQIPEDASSVENSTTLRIYNMLGAQVRELVKRVEGAGYYTVEWDSRNDNHEPMASGVYVYRLEHGRFTETRKMLLLR